MLKRLNPSHFISSLLLAAGMIFCSMPAQAQLSKTFDYAPADANVAVVVSSIDKVNANWSKFTKAIGAPMGTSLVDMTFGEMDMKKGLDTAGPAALFLTGLPKAMEDNTDPKPMMLLPVTDYKAFLTNFDATAKGDITPIKMNHKLVYARNIDKFALIGESEEAVKAYKPGQAAAAMSKKVGTYGQRYAKDGDLVIYVDLASMSKELDAQIKKLGEEQKQQMKMLGEMGMMGNQGDSAAMAFDMYTKMVGAVVRGTQSLAIAGKITDDGLILSKGMLLKKDSELAEAFPGAGAGLGNTLSNLPTLPFLFSWAIDVQAINVPLLIEEMKEMLPADDADALKEFAMYEKALPILKESKAISAAMYVPDQQALMTGGLFKTVTMYETKDGPAFIKQYSKYLKELNGLTMDAGPGMPGPNGEAGKPMKMSMATTYTPDAMKIADADVDQYTMTMNMPPEVMQQMGPAAMFLNAFTRYQGFVADKGNDVMVTTSLDTMLAKQTLEGLGKNVGLADLPQNKSADGKLDVPKPVLHSMVSMNGIAMTANMFMTMFGMPAIQVSDQLEPITTAVGMDGLNVGGQTYVPARTIRFTVDTAQGLMMQMQGPAPGQQGGQGGQAPPF